jgi:hypothetical protein
MRQSPNFKTPARGREMQEQGSISLPNQKIHDGHEHKAGDTHIERRRDEIRERNHDNSAKKWNHGLLLFSVNEKSSADRSPDQGSNERV